MGQLIDKTVLRKELSKLSSEMGFVKKSDVMQILGSQKCAYDVDKVVKKLEQEYKENESRYKKYNDSHESCAMSWLKTAINIVKAGETCQ